VAGTIARTQLGIVVLGVAVAAVVGVAGPHGASSGPSDTAAQHSTSTTDAGSR